MEIIIITGMSGAGKTAALNLCQDNDYYTLDNLPPKLIKDVIFLLKSSTEQKNKLALVIDVRGGDFFHDLANVINELKLENHKVKVIYIDASNEILLKRYKELRRPHPLGKSMTIQSAIEKERHDLEEVRKIADEIIDTSDFNLPRLKLNLERVLHANLEFKTQLVSFGFKHGILSEADVVFDVRFSENPFYNPELKDLSGRDPRVSDYVLNHEQVQFFIKKLDELIEYLIPYYEENGKESLVVGIGCTGGKHRSVAIVEELYKRMKNSENVEIYHRDSNLW
ncbi:MAG: RNase adapter RapZ [Tissierellia bacterium]|nr:RNase adapter RapZ [Tissierellia bacterium]